MSEETPAPTKREIALNFVRNNKVSLAISLLLAAGAILTFDLHKLEAVSATFLWVAELAGYQLSSDVAPFLVIWALLFVAQELIQRGAMWAWNGLRGKAVFFILFVMLPALLSVLKKALLTPLTEDEQRATRFMVKAISKKLKRETQ